MEKRRGSSSSLRSPKFETINLKTLTGHVMPQGNSHVMEAVDEKELMQQHEDGKIYSIEPQ